MKTFSDLGFGWKDSDHDWKVISETLQEGNRPFVARMMFPNGYGVSIIGGWGCYGDKDGLLELAVITEVGLNYDNGILDDVAGYLTPAKVTEYMIKVQELPNAKKIP